MELPFDSVLVLGLGKSGISAANFLAARGLRVVAADERRAEELAGLAELTSGIELATGGPFPEPGDFDLVVPSPGVPRERYAGAARRVWGDIELAARALEVPIVAVTGTNGKTTTVRMLELMLRAAGLRAQAAGNVGTPALSLVGQPLDVAVLEVSSFQLETVETFRPRVAVILNITPDHLDRHANFAAYVAAKRRILENQGDGDVAVLNFDDAVVRELAAGAHARIVPFGRFAAFANGARLDGTSAILGEAAENRRVSLADLPLIGSHNLENALAALAAVDALGADCLRAGEALVAFRGLPHRCERVACSRGVCFVNDSKATNPGATLRSIEGFAQPVVWIAGGRNKGLDFAELCDAAARRARKVVLIGEASDEIELALAKRVSSERAGSLEEAVQIAAQSARSGDVVLFSPACASFDQFASFEERGDRFREVVRALSGSGSLR